jgi:hypothetical protein
VSTVPKRQDRLHVLHERAQWSDISLAVKLLHQGIQKMQQAGSTLLGEQLLLELGGPLSALGLCDERNYGILFWQRYPSFG